MSSEQIPVDESNSSNELDTDPLQIIENEDLEPAFVDMNEVVEVEVNDEDVPMEEDDPVDAGAQEASSSPVQQVVDMSHAKMDESAHTGPVYAVATHWDAATECLSVLSGGGDDKAFLHRVKKGETPQSLPLSHAHTDTVSCAALNLEHVSEDLTKTPKYAAVGSYDGAIVVYDPDTGNKLQELEGPSDVEWLAFHPKGGSVLLAGSVADGTVWMYHVPMSKCLQVFVGHESGVTAGAFTPDGRWALSASADGTLRVWAPRTGLSKHIFRLGNCDHHGALAAGLTCLAVNGGADGQLVLVGAEDGMAHVCHVGTKKVVASLAHHDQHAVERMTHPGRGGSDEEEEMYVSVEAVGFCPSNPNWCATGGVDGVLKIWDLANNGQCRQVCRDGNRSASGGITRLKWHPELPVIFTSTSDGLVHLWDARNGSLLQTLTGHADVINDMDVTYPGGGYAVMVTASDDKTIRVFESNVPEVLKVSSPS